jgi:hypothetical protein
LKTPFRPAKLDVIFGVIVYFDGEDAFLLKLLPLAKGVVLTEFYPPPVSEWTSD